jgi:TPR repeat protein
VLGGVFICYRREDSAGFARLIYDRLTQKLGHESVFFDVDNIPPGLDFVDILSERVGQCDALIAVIGKNWASSRYLDDQPRLEDPHDFVRIEIEAALARKIRVIPILVDGATMPRPDDLPDSLKKLTRRQGIEISHTRFDSDVERLTRALSLLEGELRQREAAESERVAREERDKREAADAVAKAEQARQLGNAEAERAIEEQRAREVAIAERVAREEREAEEAAEKAEQARKLAEVEAARRAAEEQRAAETAETDRTKRAQAEPEKKTEVEQPRPEGVAAVARALFEPASAVPAPPSRPALSELSAKAVQSSGLNKVMVASIVGAVAFLVAALLTTHFESSPKVPATTTARTAETSPAMGNNYMYGQGGTASGPIAATAPTPTTPREQFQLGNNYYDGQGGVNRDYQQAMYWYRKAADQGYAEAQSRLGSLNENGRGSVASKDYGQAKAWYQKAADQGDRDAEFSLGWLYEKGRGVNKDYGEAKAWYQKAADQGYEPAKDALKRLLASDTPTASTTETKPNAPTTAQGQYAMGSHYEYGYGGVTVNYPQAAYWYRQAADQGYAGAQFNLGWLYENGLGVGKDNDRAKVWYQKAADQGNLGAQSALQRVQSQQNPSERTASPSPSPITTPQEQGLTPAEENERGDRYFYGRGVDQDYVKAMEWYRKAADQGLADGQYNVGVLHENGWGVTKDIDQAKVWYQKAADQGDAFAKDALERFEGAGAPTVTPAPLSDLDKQKIDALIRKNVPASGPFAPAPKE